MVQSLSGETVLDQLADLAREFGADSIASTAGRIAEKVSEGRFYVACVGQFKRGKSTLLNALVGSAVLPTAVIPVTAVPTVIRYGERTMARVRLQSAAWTNIEVDAVEDYVSEEKNPENAKRVVAAEIFVPSPLLKTGMCLVDTPGLGSVFAGNAAATQAFIPHIDAVIVVIGSDPPLSRDELQLVEAVSQDVHDFLIVLNKADRTSVAERAAALEFSRRVLETRLQRTIPAIFEVSALDRLEHRVPERDWERLVQALQDLVLHSQHSLVRNATDRGIRRAATQLLAVMKAERDALERPLEESERHLSRLRAILEESETAMRDLGVLLSAEQKRLSAILVEQRNIFLHRAQVKARTEFMERSLSMPRSFNGPACRRSLNQLTQEIARVQLTPWLKEEAAFVELEFRKTAQRIIELTNEFLHRLGETQVPGLEELPEDLGSDHTLAGKSQFHFHLIERVGAPASPLLFLSDLFLGALGVRGGMVRDAQDFLDQLLEVNSSRVQSDVDERLQTSRKRLERAIGTILREATAISDRALRRGRAAQTTGADAVRLALARLDSAENEVKRFMTSGYTP